MQAKADGLCSKCLFPMTIRILILDDHEMVREGLAGLLRTEPGMDVVASIGDGHEAVRVAAGTAPDVAVVDVALGDADGIDIARRIHESSPETHVLIVSMHASPVYVYHALRAGASGYVRTESAGAELIAAVKAVHEGRMYLSEKISPGAVDDYGRGRAMEHPLDLITARERQVLKLVVDGHTSSEVAKILGISPKSVDTYRSRIMLKVGVRDVAGLVKFAIRHGITTL